MTFGVGYIKQLSPVVRTEILESGNKLYYKDRTMSSILWRSNQ